MVSIQNDIMLMILESQLKIEKAKQQALDKGREAFFPLQIENEAVIKEIEYQIRELTKT